MDRSKCVGPAPPRGSAETGPKKLCRAAGFDLLHNLIFERRQASALAAFDAWGCLRVRIHRFVRDAS